MSTKRILILANSRKNNYRCVAGREIVATGYRGGVLKAWVRPVSRNEKGALLPKHYAFRWGGYANVLDIVDVSLLGPKGDPGQPENWVVDERSTWKKIRTIDPAWMAQIEEHPTDLWLEPGGETNRVSVTAQAACDPQRSLMLIRPERFHIRMWRHINRATGLPHKKTRALFEYHGATYALSITDPIFTKRFCTQHPSEGAPAVEAPSPYGDNCLLCISLTPPYNDHHYKIVATVFGL